MTTLTAVTGAFLVVVPLAFNAAFLMLQRAFDYPDILRRPTGEILQRFAAGGTGLRRLWYVFTLAALLFTPAPLLVHLVLGSAAPWYLVIGTVCGVIAALVQTLGLIRWPFLVPYLAGAWYAPGASTGTRESVEVTFQAFHRYAGVAIGEHLGYLFTAAWTVLLGVALAQSGTVPALLGWLALVPAAGILFGVLEEAGLKAAGTVNAVSYVLWSAWLVVLGVFVLVG
jgi:hypothetical protein